MSIAYFDQNAIIALGRSPLTADEAEVRRRIETGLITPMCSPAHWVETAEGRSFKNSMCLAEFIDSLRPFWLRERISLHRLEIRSFLQGLAFDQVRQLASFRTVTEALADLNELLGPLPLVSLRDIVRELRTNAQGRAILRRSYSRNERAFLVNRDAYKAGKITADLERTLEREYLRRIGQIIRDSAEDIQLDRTQQSDIRSIVCEWEVTKENWRRGGQLTHRHFQDMQHLTTALPYADVLITFDGRMRDISWAVSQTVQFPVATVVGSMRELLGETE